MERSGHSYNTLINKYGILEDLSEIECIRGSKWWNDIQGIEIREWENSRFLYAKEAYRDLISSVTNSSSPLWFKAWHNLIPLKVACFVWRLFQNKISTKENLFRKGVIGSISLNCVGECRGCRINLIYFLNACFLQVCGRMFVNGLR